MKVVLQQILRWKVVLIVILALVIIGTIHYTSLPRSRLTFIEELARDAISPLQLALTRVSRFISHKVTALKEIRYLRQRNAELEALAFDLQQQVYLLQEYERENKWLREALDFKTDVSHELLVAEVIGRCPTNWISTITINKGHAHGVEAGMAVVTNGGIVGTILDVSRLTSTVLLSTDSRSAAGGLVQSTGDLVLVEGDSENSGMLVATPLSRDTEVVPGDIIVTSGLSRLFPKKLPIGEVVEVESSPYGLSFTALVRPFVDFTRLEYVFVVLQEE